MYCTILGLLQVLKNDGFWLPNFVATSLTLLISSTLIMSVSPLMVSSRALLPAYPAFSLTSLCSPPLASLPLSLIKCWHSPGFSPPPSSLDFSKSFLPTMSSSTYLTKTLKFLSFTRPYLEFQSSVFRL